MGWIRIPLPGPEGWLAEKLLGKKPKPVEIVTGAPAAVAEAGAKAAKAAASVAEQIEKLKNELIKKVGGEAAANLVSDLHRVANLGDPQVVAHVLGSTAKFVETLDPSYLNPLVGVVAAEIKRARDRFWDKAAPIPEEVVQRMPADLAELARESRHMSVADLNALSLPAFAIQHFKMATAVTAIDLIFFKEIPGTGTYQELHYWVHELTHVRQFSQRGLEEFAKTYVNEQIRIALRGGDPNELEVEADLYACSYYWVEHPTYIGTCPA